MFLLIKLSPQLLSSAIIVLDDFWSSQLISVLRGVMKQVNDQILYDKIEYISFFEHEDNNLEFIRIRQIILEMVSKVFQVSMKDILSRSRCRAHIAFARQVAMYLTHICCGLNLTQTGQLFSRDRTTVAYACSLVEDRRDEIDFDLTLEILEKTIKEFTIIKREENIYAL